MWRLLFLQFLKSKKIVTGLILIELFLLVSCINVTYSLNITTTINEDDQITNEWVVTVPTEYYQQGIFDNIKQKAKENGYPIEDYSTTKQTGVILQEKFKTFAEFIAIYGQPSSKTKPRLLQFEVKKSRLSEIIEKYFIEIKVDTRSLKDWGNVNFHYSLVLPGKLKSHNGVEGELNKISWNFNSLDSPDYYLHAEYELVRNSPGLWLPAVMLSMMFVGSIIRMGSNGVSPGQKASILHASFGFILIFLITATSVYTICKLTDMPKEITIWFPILVGGSIVSVAVLQFQGLLSQFFFHFIDIFRIYAQTIHSGLSPLISCAVAYLPKLEKPKLLKQLQAELTSHFSDEVSELLNRLEVAPYDVDSRLELARLYVRENLYKQAVAEYQKVLIQRQEDHQVRIELIHCYNALGLRDESLRELRALLENAKSAEEGFAIFDELSKKFQQRLRNP